MPLDLKMRSWPDRDPALRGKPETGKIVGSASRTFVSEGGLVVKAVDFNGRMAPIPRESSAITSLAPGDGLLYGATSGEQSWLFQYAFTPHREAAIPLAPIPDCCEVRQSLVLAPGDVLYGAGSSRPGEESHLFRVTGLHLPGDVIQEWGVPRPHFESLDVPAAGEQVVCLRLDSQGEMLYGLTRPGGILFTFTLSDGSVNVLGEVDPVRFFSPVLIEDARGTWYAWGTTGRMVRFEPWAGRIEAADLYVPCFPGRGPYARIAAAVCDPQTGCLTVGDTEGLLSLIDPEQEQVTPLGKPTPIGGIDHLARLVDGRIFGVAGSREGMAHLFVIYPGGGGIRDLGVLCATTEKGWYGYRFGAMIATKEGRVILGEDDHLGCLFIYFPPLSF